MIRELAMRHREEQEVPEAGRVIDSFWGDYRFLSNFYPSSVVYENRDYPTVEHAYQAAKAMHDADRQMIQAARSPGKAKKLGKDVVPRPDWDRVKQDVMYELLMAKFRQPALRELLLDTGEATLVEGNNWHDNFWGSCSCERCGDTGRNLLGQMLMRVRQQLSCEDSCLL